MQKSSSKGFTLIELLVVISIISFISSVVMSSVIKARIRARDSQRIQNARQIAIALEQYEHTFSTYKVANSGLSDSGSGYVAKGGGGGYTTSILSALKSAGLYTNTNLKDPIYGLDNYYLGLCTSTNAYNVFVKLEQPQYNNATSSIVNSCGGTEAVTLGFNFIASTAGGASGGGGDSGYAGFAETGSVSQPFVCGVSTVIGQDFLTYGTVVGADTRCWLDRNLGAARVATAYNDSQAYGDYYQWGRGYDGHQISTSSPTAVLSSTDSPGHNNFITNGGGTYDWRSPQNNSLWQGVSGINNPCPSGFRIPTQPEWSTLVSGAAITNRATAYSSALKLTATGVHHNNGGYVNVGTIVYNWSSSVSGAYASYLIADATVVNSAATNFRASGLPIRCIKN